MLKKTVAVFCVNHAIQKFQQCDGIPFHTTTAKLSHFLAETYQAMLWFFSETRKYNLEKGNVGIFFTGALKSWEITASCISVYENTLFIFYCCKYMEL